MPLDHREPDRTVDHLEYVDHHDRRRNHDHLVGTDGGRFVDQVRSGTVDQGADHDGRADDDVHHEHDHDRAAHHDDRMRNLRLLGGLAGGLQFVDRLVQ